VRSHRFILERSSQPRSLLLPDRLMAMFRSVIMHHTLHCRSRYYPTVCKNDMPPPQEECANKYSVPQVSTTVLPGEAKRAFSHIPIELRPEPTSPEN
jgi:hypothetical protein